MKNLFKLIFLTIVGSLFITGCGNNDPKNDPKDAALSFFNGIKNGNVDDFRKYSTEITQKTIINLFSIQCKEKLTTDEKISNCLKHVTRDISKYEAGQVTQSNDTQASVISQEHYKNGKVQSGDFYVEKIGDQWKVHMNYGK